MSKLDLAKEKIAYLKFWLGIMVAVEVSLTGWLLTNFPSAHWLGRIFQLGENKKARVSRRLVMPAWRPALPG